MKSYLKSYLDNINNVNDALDRGSEHRGPGPVYTDIKKSPDAATGYDGDDRHSSSIPSK